jgi:predicted metalloenzyme YecM
LLLKYEINFQGLSRTRIHFLATQGFVTISVVQKTPSCDSIAVIDGQTEKWSSLLANFGTLSLDRATNGRSIRVMSQERRQQISDKAVQIGELTNNS